MDETGRDAFSQLLYPMLSPQPGGDEELLRDLRQAPLLKSAESNRLRRQVLEDHADTILAAADAIAARLRDGGRVLTMGNGGSATSAADITTELLAPRRTGPSLPSLALSNDIAVITGVANDVNFDDVFLRQLIALGRPQDAVVAVSTSGNSENLIRGVAEARRRKMLTVALCGYDGGRIARETGIDHCIVVRSSSVHRIQEVQMTVYHQLIELVRTAFAEEPTCA